MRVCAAVSCPELIEPGQRYCPACKPKRRPSYRSPESKARQRLYKTQRWRDFSKRYLAGHSTCVVCGGRATVVDHVDGLGLEGPNGWADWNCQAMCASDHARKTVAVDGGFGRPRVER